MSAYSLKPGYAYEWTGAKDKFNGSDSENWDIVIIGESAIAGSKRIVRHIIDGHPVVIFRGGNGKIYAQTEAAAAN